jgi:alanine dehydrogenase
MIIGVPKEIKTREYRVGMVPAGVRTLVGRGHKVLVEKGAGLGSGIEDAAFERAGAKLVATAAEVWGQSEMVVKVKEPLPQEFPLFRDGLILYTYLHLAAAAECTAALVKAKVSGVAYETIELADHSLPLLRPMSQVAGRMAVQVGATLLEKEHGGKGILLGGVPGTRRGKVTIIGGGVVGTNSAQMAVGLGANVTLLDVSTDRLIYLREIFGNTIELLHSDPETIERSVREADLLVGAVLVPGARAPRLVTADLIKQMQPGSVVVDVAVDQGGCVETCKATTHDQPTFEINGVIHYCVANMPGAVAHTSTFALTNETLRFAAALADKGLERAVSEDPALFKGVNTYKGHVTYGPVAEATGQKYRPLKDLF